MGDTGQNLGNLSVWCSALTGFVASDEPDLSTRQLAILMNVYLRGGPHTVRGLAETLNISKPAVSRALDALGSKGLTRRLRDETDRRNVLVQRTDAGVAFLSAFADLVRAAEEDDRRSYG
ncbi:MarR family winged helix-turn-helix transcriptional regulator [Minwuia thermotolerans]|uniref:MarR family transcriptional regulator n=1 Tax=Minwuia thermotolerans TaxID=2056226 RepID=A0A2M9G6H9_9PROT|nr:MarR family transcriptional regulator [Minwuia thermotolerans]PJK31276.1 MarR family transcriptional regulator [Minwuia thermotolerans]